MTHEKNVTHIEIIVKKTTSITSNSNFLTMRSYFYNSSSCFIGVSKHLDTIKALMANHLVLSIVPRCLDTPVKHALVVDIVLVESNT